MPLQVEWYDAEKTIVVATLSKDMTWNEYHSAVDWIVAQAKIVEHRVDVIFYHMDGMPRGNPIPHFKTGSKKIVDQANIQISVITGSRASTGFVRSILEVLTKAYSSLLPNSERERNRLIFMPTIDKAVEFIKQSRATQSAIE